MEKTFTETAYAICHNGADIIHPVQVEAGTVLTTGQPQYEEFDNKDAWVARLTELGYDVSKLEPPSLDGPAGPERAGRPGGLLTPEERKNLSPEERKALRAERRAAAANQKPTA